VTHPDYKVVEFDSKKIALVSRQPFEEPGRFCDNAALQRTSKVTEWFTVAAPSTGANASQGTTKLPDTGVSTRRAANWAKKRPWPKKNWRWPATLADGYEPKPPRVT